MVDNTTTSSAPGWVWLAATVFAVPGLCGSLVHLAYQHQLLGDDWGWLDWIAIGAVSATLAAPLLALLPRLRNMSMKARLTWALVGASVGAALTLPWTLALLIIWLQFTCAPNCDL
jgi:uncharacterized membrane protein YeaQ/YmgE (transglycosylase-associated protein family)